MRHSKQRLEQAYDLPWIAPGPFDEFIETLRPVGPEVIRERFGLDTLVGNCSGCLATLGVRLTQSIPHFDHRDEVEQLELSGNQGSRRGVQGMYWKLQMRSSPRKQVFRAG